MTLAAPTRFMIGADTFRHGTLSAADEFHCVRRVAPVVKNTSTFMFALAGASESEDEAGRIADLIEGSAPLLQAFANLSEEDSDYVIARCMGVTEMQDGDEWKPTWDAEMRAPALPQLHMIHLMRICYAVLHEAITVFFSDLLSSLTELGLLRRATMP